MVAMNVWPTDAADGSVANEARWRKMARYWAQTGVCLGTGGELVPTLAYPNLTIKSGAAWVDGHYCELLGDQVLTVTANGLAVVRFDPAANSAQLLYLDAASVPSQSPTGIYELPIAKITGSALSDQRRLTSQQPGALVWSGDAISAASVPLAVGPIDILTITPPTFPFPTIVRATYDLGFRNDAGPLMVAACSVFQVATGTAVQPPCNSMCPAISQYIQVSVSSAWTVAAGGSTASRGRITANGGYGGAAIGAGKGSVQVYAQ